MNVRELINILSEYPDDTPLCVDANYNVNDLRGLEKVLLLLEQNNDGGCYGEHMQIDRQWFMNLLDGQANYLKLF